MANTQYAQLASRLGIARRAYKRAGAMAGAVVFLIEALGVAAIVIAADVLFDLGAAGRVALFALGVIALAYFAVRHILKPLSQHITDAQVALYLEQRNPQFEGALIAATEFGQQSYTGRTAQIVDSILDQAVARAGKFDLKRAIDLSRLRKYGIAAAILVGLYVVAAVTMPQAVSRRFARVFMPWKPLPAEQEQLAAKPPELPALELSLGQGDASLVRGGTLTLQASANRAPQGQVGFHFRSLSAGGEWKMLNMSEVEKLNTYQLVLPDINEDLEFFVSAENAKTAPHRVTVFDPLLIKGFELVTKFPAYLNFPDRVEQLAAPDVAAPVGSTVTVRAIANGPVASGSLLWDGREPQALTAADATAAASFEVKENGSFRISLADTHGQQVEMPVPASVTAVIDRPPTVKQTAPLATVMANPMSEIAFIADLADDLALDGAELVVARTLDSSIPPTRIPLSVDGTPEPTGGTTAARGTIILALESLKPAVKVGDILSVYIEAKDRKGQTGQGDLTQVLVGSFESWAVYSTESHAGSPLEKFDLEPVVMAAWRLHREGSQLPPRDFHKQLEELAGSMVDSKGVLHPYFDPKEKSPEQIKHGERGMELAKQGQEQLKKHDSSKAVDLLRAALAELTAAGMGNTEVVMKPPPAGAAGASLKAELSKLNAMVQVEQPPADQQQKSETDKAAEDADALAKAEAVEEEQAKVADQMKKSADAPDNQAKNDANAAEQEKVAAHAAAAAKAIKDKAGADENKKSAAHDLAAAAATMKDAAAAAKAGKKDVAARKADDAKRQIAQAKAKLQTGSQDHINDALDKAEAATAAATRKQAEVSEKTAKAAKAGDKKKEQAAAAGADQVKLNADIKAVAEAIAGLAKAGDVGNLKPDTNKHVQDAKKALARARIEQKIANAAVQLAAGDTTGAQAEQKKIQDALDQVGAALKNASATRAGDAATALKRAKDDAAAAKAKLDELVKAKGPDKKDAAGKTAAELARLSRQMQARDFANGNKQYQSDADAIANATKDPKLADKLETKEAEVARLAKVTARLATHLEAAYDAQLKSKELFAAQREECPPMYRPLVNKYFETIGQEK